MAARAKRFSKKKKRPAKASSLRKKKPQRARSSRKARPKPKPQKKKKSTRQIRAWSKKIKLARRKKSSPKKPKKPKPIEKKEAPPKPNLELEELLSNARTRQLLIDCGGEHALDIMKAFTKELSDDDLAKKLKIKISDVRATLNRLHNLGVVQYNRYKDAETGWFSYFWSLNMEKTRNWVDDQLAKDTPPNDISTSEYYFCPKCGSESVYEFASASDYSFRCPLCNRSLEFVDENTAKDLFPRPKRP